jgi:hypothetical protein
VLIEGFRLLFTRADRGISGVRKIAFEQDAERDERWCTYGANNVQNTDSDLVISIGSC